MSGWIKLNRKILDNPIWAADPFTRGQAWIDLLLLTNHKPGYIRKGGKRINLQRGQCGWSQERLALRWQWSRGKVKRFLNECEKDEKIIQQTDTKTTILNICNYNKYQGDDTTDDTPHGTPDDTPNGHQTDTNKNDNNDKKLMIILYRQIYEKITDILEKHNEQRWLLNVGTNMGYIRMWVDKGATEQEILSAVELSKHVKPDTLKYFTNQIEEVVKLRLAMEEQSHEAYRPDDASRARANSQTSATGTHGAIGRKRNYHDELKEASTRVIHEGID